MSRTGEMGSRTIASATAHAKKAVLVVEDDRTHRIQMESILKECGFSAVPAENGFIALSKLESGQKFDLIIMDWDLPGLDGLDTVKEIRARQAIGRLPYIPVIAFTSHRQPGDREKCIAAGMDGYLPKDVWMGKWRQTLIDNLQGLSSGNFDVRDFRPAPEDDEEDFLPKSTADFDLEAFDVRALEQTAALLKNDMEIAVEEYLEDAAAYIREIQEGIESGDIQKTARGSHPLKSNSIGLGLVAVSQIAAAINALAREASQGEKTPDSLKTLLPKLQQAFYIAEKKLRCALKGLRP